MQGLRKTTGTSIARQFTFKILVYLLKLLDQLIAIEAAGMAHHGHGN
jgi:hypothetical protein